MRPKAVRQPAVVRLELRHPRERHVPDVLRVLGLADRVAHDRPEGGDGVLPADLLALFVRAPVVGDGHFEDAVAAPRHFRRELRLDAEAARLDGHGLDDLAAEHLVAGLHVRQIEVREHVGGQRQEAVADRVPEVQDAPCTPAQKARAVDDVGVPLLDRREQLQVFHRVVLEVRVLHDHHVARGVAEADRDRGSLALVYRLEEDPHAAGPVEPAQDLAGPVGGPVVDDQDLLLEGHLLHTPQDLADRLGLVVGRDHDRELHGPPPEVRSYR